jgi:TPP-dependent indolepyruvate ferredoxin oxidoreductase alpha subunit
MGRRFKGAQLRNDPSNIGQYVISIAEPKAENTVASMVGISVSHGNVFTETPTHRQTECRDAGGL